jgi:hypothetical protein
LRQFNNPAEVFNATVVDNGNSFLYNICLHWFTWLAGNPVETYIAFSKILACCALVAFFFLARQFLGNTIFVSVALLYMVTDPVFAGMATEVRAYMMGILFTCLAGIYFYKFLYEEANARNLFWFTLFCVAMLLCHYLAAYVILTMGIILILSKGLALFKGKNLFAILVPLIILLLFFIAARNGFSTMGTQNSSITKQAEKIFSIPEVLSLFMRFISVNAKFVLPAFSMAMPVLLFSVLAVAAMYAIAHKLYHEKERRKFNTIFALAICSSVFMLLLSLYVKHSTPFYNRYFSFSVPFCCLFAAMFLKALFVRQNLLPVKLAVVCFMLLPVLYIAYQNRNVAVELKYSHVDVGAAIEQDGFTDVEVQKSADAFLINSFIDNNRQVTYHVLPGTEDFVLYNEKQRRTIKLVRIDK